MNIKQALKEKNKLAKKVTWFVKRVESISNDKSLTKEDSIRLYNQAIEQAKAMHKSEIIWAHGIKMKGVNNHKCVSGEQYYNETFGGNNEQ